MPSGMWRVVHGSTKAARKLDNLAAARGREEAMAAIPVNRTEANLLRAFACEVLASRRYTAFAAQSEEEGQRRAAVVFRYIAWRRAGHAEEHLKMLGGLEEALTRGLAAGETRDNLRAAITIETVERGARYAAMARTARDEGFDEIAEWFEMLAKAGRSRARRLRRELGLLSVTN